MGGRSRSDVPRSRLEVNTIPKVKPSSANAITRLDAKEEGSVNASICIQQIYLSAYSLNPKRLCHPR